MNRFQMLLASLTSNPQRDSGRHEPPSRRNSHRCFQLRKSIYVILLIASVSVSLIIVRQVLAAEVTIDASPSGTASSHNGSSSTVVFIDDSTGYAFFRDATNSNCKYRKTTNGGGSWGAEVTVDAQSDCIKIAVWYDRWTPGDNTGTNIHILTMDDLLAAGTGGDLFYTRLNTSGDSLTTTVNATGANQGGTFDVTQNIPSITKATNGTLYMGVQDDPETTPAPAAGDSFVIKCTGTCETATNWTEAGALTNPFDLEVDWLILMPLAGGNIMAIRWDLSAGDVQSKVYVDTTDTWDLAWTNIDTSAPVSLTYDAPFGATLNKATNTIHIAYAAQNDSLNDGNDDIRSASYIGATWVPKTDVLTNTTRGVVGVKIAAKENSDAIFVVYTVRNTTGVANSASIHWKLSTDAMQTWGAEQGPLNTLTNTDIYGARVNIMSDERIYSTWCDCTNDDLLGNTVADLTPLAVELGDFTATSSKKGVRLEWRTGYEIDNLGFNIYRDKKGERIKVNPSMIAGSAFGASPGTARTAGDSYSWSDPKGTPDSVYYLEDIDLAGNLTLHGPITPVATAAPSESPKGTRATLLTELNEKASPKTSAQSAQRGYVSPTSSSQTNAIRALQLPSRTISAGGSTRLTLEGPPSPPPGSLAAAEEQQRVLAAMPGQKLSVSSTGWYRVTQQALVAAGLNFKSDLRYLQLYADGVEVPFKINSSKSSGPLRPGDSIEFYGVANDTPYSDVREYWLISGFTHGQRITSEGLKNANPGGASQSFEYTIERKERLFYLSSLLNGEAENFFGQLVYSGPGTQTISVRHLNPGADVTPRLELALQGMTVQDHLVKVLVNGTDVGSLSFSDLGRKVQQLTINNGVLHEGENSVTLQGLNGEMDISLVDYLRLSYSHTYQADNDYLQFTANGRTRVTGFTVADVVLLDVTDPNSVSFLKPQMEPTADGFGFNFETRGARTYLALTETGGKHVSGITRNNPSSWNQNIQGADFVVVTHKNFRTSVEPLAQLRRNEGLSVAVVDVEDIYDEFSYGAHTPYAIRDFLKWTKTNWQRVPRFILLAGDGSYDPRNYLGNGESDFVPARLIDTSLVETVSDDWFVDFDNDSFAEMAIGRLPVRTPAEAGSMISKIVNYSPANPVQSVLMVADKLDTKNNFSFEAASNELSGFLPSTIGAQNIFRGDNADSVVHNQVVSGINQGPLLVNYMGHGSVEVWTGAPILSTLDGSFTNGNRLPVFLMMTCLNGYYQNPARESLAESLIRINGGGAVAVWASSGMTEPQQQLEVSRALYPQLFGSQPLTLGEAIRNAKTTAGIDVRRTWILMGDPAMRIR